MEKTFLEQRIEERATILAHKEIYEAFLKEQYLQNLIGQEYYKKHLLVFCRFKDYAGKEVIELGNDFTKELFGRVLPRYIKIVTDEILDQVDQVKWLLENNDKYID